MTHTGEESGLYRILLEILWGPERAPDAAALAALHSADVAAASTVGDQVREARADYGSAPDITNLHFLVRKGLPYGAFEGLSEHLDSSQTELAELLLISRKTIQRRKKEKRLTPEESDRLVRVARILARAVGVFGDEGRARLWLRSPITALGGRSPWEFLDTDLGVRLLEEVLGRMEHGVYG